ncbi:hypothetical protein EDD17DRAFT_1768135 [Pisolithus thermaeus]|nr:hypothetical protein EDD17DRAFT_1768135 [Pisolithus thermaeus]
MPSSEGNGYPDHYGGPLNPRNYALAGAVGNTYLQTNENVGLGSLPSINPYPLLTGKIFEPVCRMSFRSLQIPGPERHAMQCAH